MYNAWIDAHGRRIEELKKMLVNFTYKGSYEEIPLMELHRLIVGSVTEVLRLQAENNRLIKELHTASQPKPIPQGEPEPPSDRVIKEGEQPKEKDENKG